MAATCMAVCKGSRKKIRGIFISSCHLPAAVECDIVILSEPGPNPTGPSWAVLQTQLIPARGRKPDHQDQGHVYDQDTTYPREGTETRGVLWIGKKNARHNLSPRGDGNFPDEYFVPPGSGHNLSPRGDGNRAKHGGGQGHGRHNLSPRGDGNSLCSSFILLFKDTTYPREGTETNHQRTSRYQVKDTTYPREGTETHVIRP